MHEGKKQVIEKAEKLHKCDLCDKSYILNNTLIKHVLNEHDGAAISNCHLCRMKFQSQEKLDDHIKLKHDSALNVSYR